MEDIKGKTKSGIKWTYLTTFLARGLYPVVLIVLARLLTPADFGLAAMALAVTGLFSCFSDMGLKHALVQQKGTDANIASLAFWILLPLGIFWFLIIWIISPFIAVYFKNQTVVPLLRVLGLMFIILPFSDVPLSILLRELKFKALFYRQLVPQLFSGTTSIMLAFMGYGAWALVIGSLSGIAGTSIVVWRMTNWRPKLLFDKTLFKSMFRFGSFMSIQSLLSWMMIKADNLFVGRFLGASTLGIYRMGSVYGHMPFQLLGLPFLNVIYPIFCKISRNQNDLRERYFLYINWISIASIPASIAFIFIVPFAVPVILGDKWLQVIPILQLIALASMFSSILGVNTEVYKAIGKPDISVKLSAIRVVVSLPFYYIAAQKNIMTLAFAHVGLTCVFVPINFYICSRVLNIEYLTIFKKLRTGLFLGIIFLAIGMSYKPLLGDNLIKHPAGDAFCLTLIFIILGGVSLFFIDRSIFSVLLEFFKSIFSYKVNETVS
jgi:O-antigen/teichoic acid export membrane protein